MKQKLVIFSLFFFALYTYHSGHELGQQGYSRKDAKKVLDLIEKIQQERQDPTPDSLSKVIVTEDEFNAYIAFRIDVEKEEIMKELKLKLFNDNKIEGKIFIDLKEQDLPRYLRPEMMFYFSGEVEVQNAMVRLDIQKLFLENQEIQPVVLDMLILFASKIGNWDSGSIKDWYELPYGIKEIRTYKGYAEFYY